MIIGIGTDMIEIERVVKACEKDAFQKKCFTEKEIEFFQNHMAKSADNFAVKEAVVKVFGTGFAGISPIEIEVLRDEKGKPYVNLYGKAKTFAENAGIVNIHVSITNTNKYASAFAVGEGL